MVYEGTLKTMNYLDLFSGIGGFALGAYYAGMQFDKHYFSDIDSYANCIYKMRFPDAIPLGDIRNINGYKLPKADWVISGGFPCQDISIAGHKAGIFENTRSGLWFEYARIIREIRPRYAIMENVSGLLITGMGTVLRDLSKAGYDAEWECLRASDIGAPHQRERVWILAYPKSERLHEIKQRQICDRKNNIPEPKEWEFFQSIFTRDYTIYNWEDYEYLFARADNGLPGRMDKSRVKAVGNAVVPQIAALIFEKIKRIENAHHNQ